MLDWTAIEGELAPRLDPLGLRLDRARLERWSADVASGRLSARGNRLTAPPEPARPEDVDLLGELDPARRAALAERGARAIEAGEVAVCVLNGGMATRFGGVVKGVVEALGGQSFLEIKLAQARRAGSARFAIMNSFATHAATEQFLAERGLTDGVSRFLQSVSLRLTPGGEAFRDPEGRLSPYAPGHGDFPAALRGSGVLSELSGSGVRLVTLSNVDNLGAELDPVVIGYHLDHGRPITCEVAPALPEDAGGAPVRVEGRVQVIEGFRFPEGWDFSRNRWLSTNSFVFDAELLAQPWELTPFYVEKQVEQRSAVQIETLVNELSARVDTAFLAAPREPARGRFFPVKSRADLEALRADRRLAERFL